MDTPEQERILFDHLTCNISASVDEVTIPGALALDLIEQVFGFRTVIPNYGFRTVMFNLPTV